MNKIRPLKRRDNLSKSSIFFNRLSSDWLWKQKKKDLLSNYTFAADKNFKFFFLIELLKREQAYKLSIGELILVGVGGGVRRNVPGLNIKTRYHYHHLYLYTVVNIRHY